MTESPWLRSPRPRGVCGWRTIATAAWITAAALTAPQVRAWDFESARLSVAPGSLRVDARQWAARLDLRLPASDGIGPEAGRPSWQLMGDYYFPDAHGLRATGGVLGPSPRGGAERPEGADPSRWIGGLKPGAGAGLGLSGLLDLSASDQGPSTYVGLGYSRPPALSGWGLSADLGLLALREPAQVRLGQNGPGTGDWPRSLRLRPLLQVGVSYAF